MICEASAHYTATNTTVYCTLEPGHDGPHEAHGLTRLIASWPTR